MAANPNNTNALTLPSVLAFSRKLEVSDALMTSGLWADIDKTEQWQPISLHDKRNRATHSQYGAKDEDKSKPNLSWGDDATLPHDADTLRIKFTLRILGQLEEPTACNAPEFQEKVIQFVSVYRDEHQFKELATRYANNIVNGRFLWRNRVGAESISIKVQHGKQTWLFDAYDYPLNEFSPPADSNHPFGELIAVIQNGLQGDGFTDKARKAQEAPNVRIANKNRGMPGKIARSHSLIWQQMDICSESTKQAQFCNLFFKRV